MGKKPVEEVWLTLEQVAELLGLPWSTVFRWARDGDPRLPAYKVWDKGLRDQGRYRFQKKDVEAFQALTQPQEVAASSS